MDTHTPMRPWERRLADLGRVLQSCHEAYFSPDLFRMNTNHFLQTARTVTFIIQKNKSSIPDYDAWYRANVIEAWADDSVMTWAKNARNVIEKEGDLETNSVLSLALIFSYLSEEDIALQTGRTELLRAGLKVLIRFARKHLPTGIEDAAAVRIERRWVANSLPEWELLRAMQHIYNRLHDACKLLAKHLGQDLPTSVSRPVRLQHLAGKAQGILYLKLSNLKLHEVAHVAHNVLREGEPPAPIKRVIEKVGPRNLPSHSLESTVDYMIAMAEATFNEYGHHVPMLFLFDNEWHPVHITSAYFADQTDKFIFWRGVADDVKSLNAYGLSWTSESWVRALDRHAFDPIRKLPIVGERLHTVVIDRTGNVRNAVWSIDRASNSSTPTLCRMQDIFEVEQATPFYLIPVMRALGLPDPPIKTGPNAA